MPSGEFWEDIKASSFYPWASVGGLQVDVLFLISGLLIGRQLRFSDEGVISWASKRFCRLWPVLVALVVVQHILADINVEPGDRSFLPSLQLLSMTQNLWDLSSYGTMTFAGAWSVAVDFQTGIILALAASVLRRVFRSTRGFELAAALCFGGLFVASFGCRYLQLDRSDAKGVSLLMMPDFNHVSPARAGFQLVRVDVAVPVALTPFRSGMQLPNTILEPGFSYFKRRGLSVRGWRVPCSAVNENG